MPAAVALGQTFSVTVITYGGGCIQKGETTVQVEELRAEIRPYDYNTAPLSGPCTLELRKHEHVQKLSFAAAGEAEVVFYGLKEDASGVTNTSHTRVLEVR